MTDNLLEARARLGDPCIACRCEVCHGVLRIEWLSSARPPHSVPAVPAHKPGSLFCTGSFREVVDWIEVVDVPG